MKKSLLIGLLAMFATLSSFALEVGERVYAKDGRYEITGENQVTGDLTALEGLVAITADETKTLTDLVAYSADDEGLKTTSNAATEGFYLPVEVEDATATHIISIKIKGYAANPQATTNTDLSTAGANRLNITAGALDGTEVGRPVMLTEEMVAYNFSVSGSKTYYIQFKGLNAATVIGGIEVCTADPTVDMRLVEQKKAQMNTIMNATDWKKFGFAYTEEDPSTVTESEQEAFTAVLENYDALLEVTEEMDYGEYSDIMDGVEDAINDFFPAVMGDYAAETGMDSKTRLTSTAKVDKQTTYGDWTAIPAGRLHSAANETAVDLGHYAGQSVVLNAEAGVEVAGMSMQKTLQPGVYSVFLDSKMFIRPSTSSGDWGSNKGLECGMAALYFVDTESGDTVATTHYYPIKVTEYTTNFVIANIEKEGTYKIGISGAWNFNYNTKHGGTMYVDNFKMYDRLAGKYSANQLKYEENVRLQITTGRDALTKADGILKDETVLWSKGQLSEAIATVEPLIAEYEKLTQDEIIATYDEEVYVGSDLKTEAGLLEFEVYDKATKIILAANKKVEDDNKLLANLENAISKATDILNSRVYDAATLKEAFNGKIEEKQALLDNLKKDDYSEDNADMINTSIKELDEAATLFMNSVPSDKITTIFSFDFTTKPTYDTPEEPTVDEPATAVFPATTGTANMSIPNFTTITPVGDSNARGKMMYELGIDNNGDKDLPNTLRIGYGNATVDGFNLGETGTNIYKISSVWYFVRLSDSFVGFDVRNADDVNVSGLVFDQFAQSTTAGKFYDPCGIQNGQNYFVANTAGDAASATEDNKTTINLFLDYGAKKMHIETVTPAGNYSSTPVEFTAEEIATINIIGTYPSATNSYIGRRTWLESLTVEKIEAGPDAVDGVTENGVNVPAVMKKLVDGKVLIETVNGTFNVGGVLVK